MDTNKQIILVGKGNTALKLIETIEKNPSFLEDKYLCCINSAYKLFPKGIIDILCFNDIETIKDPQFCEYTFKNVILPYKLRGSDDKGNVRDLDQTYESIKEFFSPATRFYLFSFPWQNFSLPILCPKIGSEYGILSSTHTAICILGLEGFKSFLVYGVSKDGKYHTRFELTNDTGNKRSAKWYEDNYLLIESYFKLYKCKYQIL